VIFFSGIYNITHTSLSQTKPWSGFSGILGAYARNDTERSGQNNFFGPRENPPLLAFADGASKEGKNSLHIFPLKISVV